MSGRGPRFVADFVGSANVLPPDLAAALRGARLGEPAAGGDPARRPRTRRCRGRWSRTRYLGAGTRVAVDLGGAEVSLLAPPGPAPEPGAGRPRVGRGGAECAGG